MYHITGAAALVHTGHPTVSHSLISSAVLAVSKLAFTDMQHLNTVLLVYYLPLLAVSVWA